MEAGESCYIWSVRTEVEACLRRNEESCRRIEILFVVGYWWRTWNLTVGSILCWLQEFKYPFCPFGTRVMSKDQQRWYFAHVSCQWRRRREKKSSEVSSADFSNRRCWSFVQVERQRWGWPVYSIMSRTVSLLKHWRKDCTLVGPALIFHLPAHLITTTYRIVGGTWLSYTSPA